VLAGLGGALALAASARPTRAGSGRYAAMLVNCIDPRFTSGSHSYMGGLGMRDLYSHFVIAGGPLGAVHPRFATWHAAFWDNLDITCALHGIGTVVALTHRDCGAAKLALGEAAVGSRAAETASHGEVLGLFRAEVARRKPELRVVAGVMALDGTVEAVA
jgi:carbonic anhydrase